MAIVPYPKALDKWAAHKSEAHKVAATLHEVAASHPPTSRLEGRAARMARCSDWLEYRYCQECTSMHITRTWLCRDRLCPLCAWRLSLRRIGEMMQTLNLLHEEGTHLDAAMLTLTIKNCATADLPATVDKLFTAWRLLSLRRPFKKHVAGYCRSLEITKGTQGMHPHFHVLVFFREGYTADISTREWASMWRESLGVDYTPICDIRRAYAKENLAREDAWTRLLSATAEAVKYAVKGSLTTAATPEELDCINSAIAKKMLISYGGIIRKARARLRLSDHDEPDQVQDTTIECPKCGSMATVALSYEWAEGSYLMAPYSTAHP